MKNCSVVSILSRCEHLGSMLTTEQYCDEYGYLFNEWTIKLNPVQLNKRNIVLNNNIILQDWRRENMAKERVKKNSGNPGR